MKVVRGYFNFSWAIKIPWKWKFSLQVWVLHFMTYIFLCITIWDNYYYPPKERKFYMSSWSRPAVINVMILSKLYAGTRQGFFKCIEEFYFLKMFQFLRYCSEKSCLSTQFFLKLIPHILYDKMKLFMIKILKLMDND